MLNNEPITIFGDGEKTRDFTYIDDIVKVNVKLLESHNADGKVMNIGSGNRISINDLSNNFKMIFGDSSVINYVDAQKGDAEHTLADVGLAKQLFNYKPTIDIIEGLNKFVDWYKESGE